ncbi:hypothetical protein TNIN_255581 [Trichonephila inaurata madagascariensis]|uniref:Uncharacterized protein n=1 Tax=Trichonephila inaurata madagascariensis TaxID=2747483 RepID=A0A8X6YIU4_9ARAC|nr:hypothetical protein TNIN_255581 [Trichonephila inaurata madagascariensis]
MNVRQFIGFNNSGQEICPSVIKLEQDDHRSWMTKLCRRPLRRTVVKRVVNLPDDSTLPVVRLHLHHLGKAYWLSKWVPHTLLEVHKQQRMSACL